MRSATRHFRQRGYNLVELAIVTTVAIMLTYLLAVNYIKIVEQQRVAATKTAIAQIKEAVVDYAARNGTKSYIVVNGDATTPVPWRTPPSRPYLPCPDITGDGIEDRRPLASAATLITRASASEYPLEDGGGECYRSKGLVPWRTLKTPKADPWGNFYTYRVARDFSSAAYGFDSQTRASDTYYARPLRVDAVRGRQFVQSLVTFTLTVRTTNFVRSVTPTATLAMTNTMTAYPVSRQFVRRCFAFNSAHVECNTQRVDIQINYKAFSLALDTTTTITAQGQRVGQDSSRQGLPVSLGHTLTIANKFSHGAFVGTITVNAFPFTITAGVNLHHIEGGQIRNPFSQVPRQQAALSVTANIILTGPTTFTLKTRTFGSGVPYPVGIGTEFTLRADDIVYLSDPRTVTVSSIPFELPPGVDIRVELSRTETTTQIAPTTTFDLSVDVTMTVRTTTTTRMTLNEVKLRADSTITTEHDDPQVVTLPQRITVTVSRNIIRPVAPAAGGDVEVPTPVGSDVRRIWGADIDSDSGANLVCARAPCSRETPPVSIIAGAVIDGSRTTVEVGGIGSGDPAFAVMEDENILEGMPFVIVSHGKNGYGAAYGDGVAGLRCRSIPASHEDERQNAFWLGNLSRSANINGVNAEFECPEVTTDDSDGRPNGFVSRAHSGPGSDIGPFDDIVDWMSAETLIRQLQRRQALPVQPLPPLGLEGL